MNSKKCGMQGDELTAKYLTGLGFKIIAKNFHSRYGELDLVAANENLILFVEVKTRKANSLVLPAEAVFNSKIKKIIKTAVIFLEKKNEQFKFLQPRFDVSEVIMKACNSTSVNHIENAFDFDAAVLAEER